MLGWLQATADWAGPIAAILNFLIALVGVPVAIWKGRQARDAIVRWFTSILGWTQDASNQSADAAQQAGRAAADAGDAKKSAGDASENSRQANAALGYVGETLGDNVGEVRRLARRLDDYFTANQLLRTTLTHHGIPIPDAARVDSTATGETEAQYTTGRHRFHTGAVPTREQQQEEPW